MSYHYKRHSGGGSGGLGGWFGDLFKSPVATVKMEPTVIDTTGLQPQPQPQPKPSIMDRIFGALRGAVTTASQQDAAAKQKQGTTNMVLIGGAALAAYLLFFRKKGRR